MMSVTEIAEFFTIFRRIMTETIKRAIREDIIVLRSVLNGAIEELNRLVPESDAEIVGKEFYIADEEE